MLGFKQLRSERFFSYLLFDESSLHAALIDPYQELMNEYREQLVQNKFKLSCTLETGALSPDLSATGLLAREFGCATHNNETGRGKKIGIGKYELEAIENSYVARGILFVKDRFSIPETASGLPDSILLYSTLRQDDLLFSTLGAERKKKLGNVGDPEPVTAIGVEKYQTKLQKKSSELAFIDVRESDEYQGGHIPGVQNIPLSELGSHLPTLLNARRIYFSCQSGRRSALAAHTLSYLGCKDAVNVTGGYKAWAAAGLPIEK